MNSDKKEKVCLPLKKKNWTACSGFEEIWDICSKACSPIGTDAWRIPGICSSTHIVSELSAATFLLVKYVNRTCCHLVSLRQWEKHLGSSEKVTSLSFHRKGNFQDAGMKGLHLWPQVRFLGCVHWWSLVSAWNCLDGRVFGSHTQQQKGESNMHAHT